MKSLGFLLASVWNLGFRLGFRYWRIYRKCCKDPSVVARWEASCRLESVRLRDSDPVMAGCFRDWADQLSGCPWGSSPRGGDAAEAIPLEPLG